MGPRSATNSSPAARLRESIETPVAFQLVRLDPPVADAASWADNCCIVEGTRFAADDLPGFVPFTCDDQKIAGESIGNCDGDRLATVADLDSVRGTGKDCAANLLRRFVSRVVVCHVNPLRQASRCLAHQGALAGIAIA